MVVMAIPSAPSGWMGTALGIPAVVVGPSVSVSRSGAVTGRRRVSRRSRCGRLRGILAIPLFRIVIPIRFLGVRVDVLLVYCPVLHFELIRARLLVLVGQSGRDGHPYEEDRYGKLCEDYGELKETLKRSLVFCDVSYLEKSSSLHLLSGS